MLYQLDFRVYRRRFRQPLQTRHGFWSVREGMIIQLTTAEGHQGWGEIAPLSWFGSENFEQALQFCRQAPRQLTETWIHSIPNHLPACQFGFESAWEMTTVDNSNPLPIHPLPRCYLLPTGAAALQHWPALWDQGARTFKWKIGVASLKDELGMFRDLMAALPPSARVRLDANGGLTLEEAQHWLQCCDAVSASTSLENTAGNNSFPEQNSRVEFLEQPLPPEQFDIMANLQGHFVTPMALDESVATVAHLETCYDQGWRGVVVVKPAIAGFPSRLRQVCSSRAVDLVWSSVFETAIARSFIETRLVPSTPHYNRALGFGVHHWFADQSVDQSDAQDLWQNLPCISSDAIRTNG